MNDPRACFAAPEASCVLAAAFLAAAAVGAKAALIAEVSFLISAIISANSASSGPRSPPIGIEIPAIDQSGVSKSSSGPIRLGRKAGGLINC